LFDLYCETNRPQEAIAVGRRLIESAPDRSGIHQKLAELAMAVNDLDFSIEQFDRARATDPFNRELNVEKGRALRQRARIKAIAGDLTSAEADLYAVEAAAERIPKLLLLCQRAMLAYKSGDQNAGDRLADEARAISAAGAAWALLSEAVFLKLPKSVREPLERAFAHGIESEVDVGAAADLAEIALDLTGAEPSYRGFKKHVAAIQRWMTESPFRRATAGEYARLCAALEQLGWIKPFQLVARTARTKFPAEPAFLYLEARAELDDPKSRRYALIERNLARARKLAEAGLRAQPQMQELLDAIDEAQRECDEDSPFAKIHSILEMLGGKSI
jgi:hypothetical protein